MAAGSGTAPVWGGVWGKNYKVVDLPDDFKFGVKEKFIAEMAALPISGEKVPRHLRKAEECYMLNENVKMRQCDNECRLMNAPSQYNCPGPFGVAKFEIGQAVHHWWSSWFYTATVPLMQIQGVATRKRGRPAWYDARIIMALGVKKLVYAGHEIEKHCYQVH